MCFSLIDDKIFTNRYKNAKMFSYFGDVPKWSYRDALEMRLSSNRHESSNLSVSAKNCTHECAFLLGEGESVLSHTDCLGNHIRTVTLALSASTRSLI